VINDCCNFIEIVSAKADNKILEISNHSAYAMQVAGNQVIYSFFFI
jgi:hypothetical protein